MNIPHERGDGHWCELRLMLEELCCDLCRFELSGRQRLPSGKVRIDREYALGNPNAFADIRVQPVRGAPYFIEVKFGYPNEALVRRLGEKYRAGVPGARHANRLVLVIDTTGRQGWEQTLIELRKNLRPGLKLEIRDEAALLRSVRECFQIEVAQLTAENLLDIRQEIDRAKGYYAFGAASREAYAHDPLHAGFPWLVRTLPPQMK